MQQFRVWSWPGLLAGALLIAAASGRGLPDPSPTERLALESLAGPVTAVVDRVVDGDTIEVRAQIWLGQTLTVRVRIDGVDAPELEARCPEERRLAEEARDYLAGRLQGGEVNLTRVVYDKYGGRVRAAVSDARGDLASALLSAHLVRPYHGERCQLWCGMG